MFYFVSSLFKLLFSIVFFFFFQAEDGIRDGHVTGVQTCALPISCWVRQLFGARLGRDEELAYPAGGVWKRAHLGHDLQPRSEERRVGKECRSRWSRYH